MKFKVVEGDVRSFITNPKNKGAIFQVASQFNCLEMTGPSIRPEDGITRYMFDKTQGPACALCCPAATVYRNYFWNDSGQSKKQINLIDKIEEILFENKNQKKIQPYWKMVNGYCLFNDKDSLDNLNSRLKQENGLYEDLRDNFKIGIQYETEVRLNNGNKDHRITQIFCSALPISYSHFHAPLGSWKLFASLVLESCYDATLTFASKLAEHKKKAKEENKRVQVFLTSVGGGVFGNRPCWIESAIQSALQKHEDQPLDVYLIKYK